MKRPAAFLPLAFLLSAPVGADTPIATTLYKEGAGKIEGDLLADTVRSVTVATGTITVVQRDADAAESTSVYSIGGGGGGGIGVADVDARIRPFARAATDIDDLDSLGVSDIAADDHLFVHDGSGGAVDRLDVADLVDYVEDEIEIEASPTNLGYTPAPGKGTVTSSSGNDADLPAVDATNAGLMTPAQRSKLAGVEAAATADQSPAEIRDALQSLTGAARLDAAYVKDLPSGAGAPTEQQVYDHVKNIVAANRGLQVGDNDAARRVTIGQVELRRTDGQLTSFVDNIVAVFARAGSLVGATRDKVQQIVYAFTGGGWTWAVAQGDLGTTHPYTASQHSATPYDATTVKAGTWGGRYTVGTRWTGYGRLRVPKAFNPPGEVAFFIGLVTQGDDDPDYQRYPLVAGTQGTVTVRLVTEDATYRWWEIGPVDKPAGESWGAQINEPFELDPKHVRVPQVPDQVSLAEAEDGTDTNTRLWSPADVRAAIEELGGRNPPLTELLEGPGPGLTITNSSQTVRSALFPLATAFDLDGAANQHGVVDIDAVVTMSGRSSTSVGFDTDPSDPQLVTRIQGFTTLTRVRATADYAGSQATTNNGILIGSAQVRNGSGTPGRFDLRVGHDSLNQMSVYLVHVGDSGALSYNVGTDVTMVVFHADGGTGAVNAPRSFALAARPSAAVDVATPAGSVSGAWSAWSTLATTAAVQAAQAGDVLVTGESACDVVEASAGGGDRVMIETRIVRVRGAATTTLAMAHTYGPRNLAANPANTSAAFAEASRGAHAAVLWSDAAAAGDVYAVQARAVSQLVTADVRTVRCNATDSGVLVAPI